MSRDLDTRARRAADGLKSAIESADLTLTPPSTAPRRRPLVVVLRPALIGALLLLGSAVGIALVSDSTPPATTLPPTTTTTPVGTSSPAQVAPVVPVTPTTAYVPPTTTPTAPPTTVAADLEPPHIAITFPEEGATFSEKTLTFEGVTEPGARVFAGRYEAEVDAAGKWHIALILSEGSNVARFVARDEAGNESTAAVTVSLATPKPTTTTTVEKEKELGEFTASATFGSCSETPPYDVYYGKGQPGSLIRIESEYGSATVEVGAEGHWEKKVFFETAPANQPFVVKVKDEYGRSAQFEFVYLPA